MSKRDHADFWTLPEVLAWAKKRDPPDAFRDSLLTLHELCNAGHVKALGHPDDRRSGAPLPILASDWVGLYFDNDGKKLRSADLLDGGRIAWTSVRFSEADLVREWPKAGAAAFVAEQADRYWADRFRERGKRSIREQRRREFINRFVAKQQRIRRWISFVAIADACARAAAATSIVEEDEARGLAYRRLVESMARGEFEKNGESWVLLLFPDLHASIPPHRLTCRYFQAMVDEYGVDDFTNNSGLVRHHLWFCWLPFELCQEWFERHLLAWPDEFNPKDQTLGTRPRVHEENAKAEASEPTPNAVAPQKARRGRALGSGSFDDDETLVEMLRLLASNKAKSRHAAASHVVAAGMAERTGTAKSAVKRLRGKFVAKFGPQPPEGKTWSDIALELESK